MLFKLISKIVASLFSIVFFLCILGGSTLLYASNLHVVVPVPKRIISLSPGITEILFALGLGDKVVGDTTYCDYPPAAKSKTHIGDVAVNYEVVVALKPDLVVADNLANEAAIPKLKSFHAFTVDDLPFNNILAVQSSILILGKETGTQSKAKSVIATMLQKEAAAKQVAAHLHSPMRYVFLVGAKPLWVAGKTSFIASALDIIGADNVAPSTHFQAWSLESLIAAQPNVILCNADDKSAILSDPAWQAVPAVQHKNIVVIDPDTIERSGPRLGDGILKIANQLTGMKL